jgi:hypothetical protein
MLEVEWPNDLSVGMSLEMFVLYLQIISQLVVVVNLAIADPNQWRILDSLLKGLTTVLR